MNWAALIAAVAMIESGNDPAAVNRTEGAYGLLQVRQCALDDVNAHYGLGLRMVDVRVSRDTSRLVFILYVRRWGAETPEQAARIWNGGPRGMEKTATLEYWARVRALMEAKEKGESNETDV